MAVPAAGGATNSMPRLARAGGSGGRSYGIWVTWGTWPKGVGGVHTGDAEIRRQGAEATFRQRSDSVQELPKWATAADAELAG